MMIEGVGGEELGLGAHLGCASVASVRLCADSSATEADEGDWGEGGIEGVGTEQSLTERPSPWLLGMCCIRGTPRASCGHLTFLGWTHNLST